MRQSLDSTLVHLFTDGACIGNPGPGGWAFILKHPSSGRRKEASGGEPGTTNNRMEITAVIRGLHALKRASTVEIFSDSQYVVNAMTSWMSKWKQFGWKKKKHAGEKVANADLWEELDQAMLGHTITVKWVRGHAGHRENERCDELATAAAARTPNLPVQRVTEAKPGLFSSAVAKDHAQE